MSDCSCGNGGCADCAIPELTVCYQQQQGFLLAQFAPPAGLAIAGITSAYYTPNLTPYWYMFVPVPPSWAQAIPLADISDISGNNTVWEINTTTANIDYIFSTLSIGGTPPVPYAQIPLINPLPITIVLAAGARQYAYNVRVCFAPRFENYPPIS